MLAQGKHEINKKRRRILSEVLSLSKDEPKDKKPMYFVYLIGCSDKSIYTGVTTDIQRRFNEHKTGIGGHYTRSKRVARVLYTEQFKTRSEALKREAQIKGWRREKKLNLIKFGTPVTKS